MSLSCFGDRPRTADPAPDPSRTFCQGHAKFTDGEATHTFRVQGEVIRLRHHPDVFPPSAFGLRLAEQVDFAGCCRAADVGTGTGLLAILAALKGVGEVKATDTSDLALRLTGYNAGVLNRVDAIETRHGPFFCDLRGSFDTITANLPQEIIPPAYGRELSDPQRLAIEGGGAGGNAVLLDFLRVAPDHMHAGTALYVIVNTVTDYRATLRAIKARFEATLLWQGLTPTKAFVRDNAGFFRDLVDAGTVSLVRDADGRWHAWQFIYRLALR